MLTAGRHHGAANEPTVIADAKPPMKVVRDQVFGPVVSLLPYEHIEDVFGTVSAGHYGLQTGIFTTSMELAIRAARSLRTRGRNPQRFIDLAHRSASIWRGQGFRRWPRDRDTRSVI